MTSALLAPHPFGDLITEASLTEKFAHFHQWEDRYRQLNTADSELSGCEHRVWLSSQQRADGTLHFYGDSEGRIVRGLLAVLLTAVEGKTPAALLATDPLALFDTLGLRAQLSASRSSGLQALAEAVQRAARAHQAD